MERRGRMFVVVVTTLSVAVAALSVSAGAALGPVGRAATVGRPAVSGGPLSGARSVASDPLGSACAVLVSGSVRCWGANSYGQLGNATTSKSLVAVRVRKITDAVAITGNPSGGSYCALLATSEVHCWGKNTDGQLGNGTTANSAIPVRVKKIANAVAVVGGDRGFCALLATERISCWGYNGYGELGNGTNTSSSVPVPVKTIAHAKTLIVGYYGYCALLANQGLDCWGYGPDGELGNGTFASSNVPVAVTGITNATTVGTDRSGSACAVLSTGAIECWGNNVYGQLGNGTKTGSNVPVAVKQMTTAVAVSGNTYGGSYCAVLSTGSMKCWGRNENGQLGNATNTGYTVPVPVMNITNATAVIGGYSSFCALLSTNSLDCWGYGPDGELGNGAFASSNVPVAVTGITNAAALSGGGNRGYCALLSATNVECWGANADGELGNGTNVGSNVPVGVIRA